MKLITYLHCDEKVSNSVADNPENEPKIINLYCGRVVTPCDVRARLRGPCEGVSALQIGARS